MTKSFFSHAVTIPRLFPVLRAAAVARPFRGITLACWILAEKHAVPLGTAAPLARKLPIRWLLRASSESFLCGREGMTPL
jgi:hypothetical protein